MTESGARRSDDHSAVWEILPWYINGTLNEQESSRVKAHLLICSSCRNELVRCQDIVTAVHTARKDTWAPSPRHLSQVMERIDVATTTGAQPRVLWWQRLLARFRTWREGTPPSTRWALAFQGTLVVTLASALVWQAANSPAPQYETLTTANEVTSVGKTLLQIVFADGATEEECRSLLIEISGSIVRGPSALGIYTVALPGHKQLEPALARLRAHPKVRLAEPVSAGTSP